MIKNVKNAVEAAMICAAKNDVRYYLESVSLWVDSEGNVETVFSTDGHTAVIIGKKEQRTDEAIIIDRRDVPKFLAVYENEAHLNRDGNALFVNGTEIRLVDGRVPDYNRLLRPVTERLNVSEMGLNTEYMARVEKVRSKLWKGVKYAPRFRNAHLYFFAGNAPIRFDLADNESVDECTVLISPVKL